MRAALILIGLAALAVAFAAPTAFMFGAVSLEQSKGAMLAATIVWFATAPFWLLSDGGKTRDNSTPAGVGD